MLSILPGFEARTKFFLTFFYVCLFHLVLVRHLLQFKLLLEQRGLQSHERVQHIISSRLVAIWNLCQTMNMHLLRGDGWIFGH